MPSAKISSIGHIKYGLQLEIWDAITGSCRREREIDPATVPNKNAASSKGSGVLFDHDT
jgi:hypothetical protein